ncbi:MAG: bifunctional heptose 7-phosphate kinase/heptose 1-phosphate adenyltransferase [Acidobacteriota bacterium]
MVEEAKAPPPDGPRITVVGDAISDVYLHGKVRRLSPEAPIPVVQVEREERRPGGAANVACNLARLGARVTLLAAAARDSEGFLLRESLDEYGVETVLVDAPATTRKVRVLGSRQHISRLDYDTLLDEDRDRDRRLLDAVPGDSQLVVISDYGKGLCSTALCRALIQRSRSAGSPVLVDPHRGAWDRYRGATLLTPNLEELSAATDGRLKDDDEVIEHAGEDIRRRYELDALLVTRSERGMTLLREETCEHHPTLALDVFDVSGAGDTVIAAVAAARGWGWGWSAAVDFANRAARVVVGKSGTATASLEEIEGLAGQVKERDLDQLVREVEEWRRQGLRLVVTNGCFDLLHAGHVVLLESAKRLGDRLVVAVNDDAGVQRLKGPSRPLNNLSRRVAVLSALSSVDRVLPFSEDTPRQLLEALSPDVLVKGGDYRLDEVIGREFAKETVLVPLVEELSTTRLAEHLRESRLEEN